MSTERPALRALAERLGISAAYFDIHGGTRATSDATREALVAAMRHDGSSEAAAARSLAALDAAAAAALVEPVLVWREFEEQVPVVPVAAPALRHALDCEIELRLESGERVASGVRIEPDAPRPVAVRLPERPPLGYHQVAVRVAGRGVAREAVLSFVMAPRTAQTVGEKLGETRLFGLWSNLYSIRSRRHWGHGDATDLAELLRFCAREGGAFVGVNPLHAVANRGTAITPYSPSSRRYRNVLYLDVEAVPEWAACAPARARAAAEPLATVLPALRAADRLDHAAILDAKLAVLRELHACFVAAGRERPGSARARAFDAYLAREGDALGDFATWEVLAELFAAPGASIDTQWRQWPAAYRRPDTVEVAAFRVAHAEAIELRMWLQFELDRQLAAAAAVGRDAGLALGLYQDLAIGSARDSADTWMAPDLFAHDVSIGAPPDDYAPEGQNWGLPPFDPHALRADGHRFFAALVRASFAHSGALRIDHAMGLARLFWIPKGRPGSEGTYVRYPVGELLGVLALESRRAGALVIAEDLGTVPAEFPPLLAEWGMLSSSVLYFERDGAVPRASGQISARSLATLQTHDLVPLAGFAEGADLALRRALGELADDAAFERARAERAAEYAAWIARLREEGLLAHDAEPDATDFAVALHAFLARTPALLVGVSLDDLAGEHEPVNVPGVPVERHRSWSRRMQRTLPEIAAADPSRRILAALGERGRSSL